MTPVKNIIFDLGNVLYDIDFDILYQRFDALGIPNFENQFTLDVKKKRLLLCHQHFRRSPFL